ncbi:extracellular matrix protein 1 isoform X1 [Poecilia formosa]|uniref:Extracellular matrix protein 1b n=1 Tax=Poecilia formosa TaxID=48698 RepID=A0A087YD20_POEFO|nr:PREDICTED: extracellular matrix protein 1 isoform X1 [Poecilia formosa]
MGSSWALVCAAASLLVFLSSACKDAETCLQREVTISPDFPGQVLEEPDFMMQREVDLSEFLNFDDLLTEQRKEDKPGPGRGRPSFRPRAFPPPQSYPVQFPLGRPTPDNIQAICVYADHRPRYPDSYFPRSGFSKQRRMATAVNNAESWFSACCKGNQTWGTEGTLCCATQAWEQSVQLFCEEDSSVKDRLYECCRRRGMSRLSCFNDDAQNPNYNPSQELPVEEIGSSENFHFNLNNCPRIRMSPSSIRALGGEKPEINAPTSPKIDINFPPGRPTADNIESLCGNRKRRPLYTTKCLPRSGYELLARQVKTINRLEKRFKQCCKKKKGALNCAEHRWREELNRYCSVNGRQECCQTDDHYSCFQSLSSDPLYNTTSAAEEPTLNKMCDTQIIDNRLPVGFQLKTQCCPLPEQDRNSCFELNLVEMSQILCSSNKSHSPVVRRCCKMTLHEEIQQCLSKNVMKAITKATKKGQKKKKICPIP